MCSDSEKNISAFADQNHAPSLTCVLLEIEFRHIGCTNSNMRMNKGTLISYM